MKEIKFRAWDDERSLMIYDFENIEHPAAIEYIITAIDGLLKVGAYKANGDFYELEILESTGLKDKNGKEIYEGDKLEREHFSTWIVCWHEAGFSIYNQNNPGNYFKLSQTNLEDRYISGNIYENPELLKQTV